jgi:hypothetical protein
VFVNGAGTAHIGGSFLIFCDLIILRKDDEAYLKGKISISLYSAALPMLLVIRLKN